MFITTGRIIKYSLQNFFRNFWLSFVTLTILFLALASINILIVLQLLANTAIKTVEGRVDVSVYFKSDVKEEQLLSIQRFLLSQEGVTHVAYISREEALETFKARHKNEPKILETLNVLSENPLGAALVIKADSPENYDKLITVLEGDQYKNLIEDKDFEDYRLVIDRITRITSRLSNAVSIMAIVFSLISMLILFNTLRVAVYTHREEIKIMRLVGATNSFIIMPYVVEGWWFAIFGMIITVLVLYPMLGIVQPYISTFFDQSGVVLVDYFNTNSIKIFGLELLIVSLINTISALVAVRKYLKEA